jgi:tripartite-type tricarboxylate transporter receptor subunit TctC
MGRTQQILIGALGLCLLLGSGGWAATSYPDRPITLIVPNPPGGTNDIQGRALAEAAKKFLPSPITIVNRPGGGGAVGISEAVQARPNGYTLAVGGLSSCILIPLTAKVPYKGPADFQPVIKIANIPLVLAVQAQSSWKTMPELLSHAKTSPGKIRAGTAGIGSLHHLHLENLKGKAGVDMTHVPFAGGAESTTALLGGHIEAVILPPSVVVGHVKAGKIRILGIFDEKRHPMAPEVPTFREMGYDITQGNYALILVPKKTPEPVVTVLHDALKKAIETDFFRKFAEEHGYLISSRGLGDLAKELEHDFAVFGEMVKKLGLRKD